MRKMKPEPTILPLSGEGISILVVEDDKIVRDLLKAIISLKLPELTIYLAEDGSAGLDLFKKHRPQIVITDINMPKMDGIKMAHEIRTVDAETRILVITAYDHADSCEKFERIGIEDCFVKPIAFEKLFASIEKCLVEIAP